MYNHRVKLGPLLEFYSNIEKFKKIVELLCIQKNDSYSVWNGRERIYLQLDLKKSVMACSKYSSECLIKIKLDK